VLESRETTGTDVPASSLGVDHRLLEPLWVARVRGLQCFLLVCCAPVRAPHAFAWASGAGSSASRARSREACVICKRCAAGCLAAESGTVRTHDGPRSWFMACLVPL
jgi:hypothetical protein